MVWNEGSGGFGGASGGSLIAAGICLAAAVTFSIFYPESSAAVVLLVLFGTLGVAIFRNVTTEKEFVTKTFLLALALRVGFGVLLSITNLRDFFAPDVATYDHFGWVLQQSWFGAADAPAREIARASQMSGPGWGMNYLVAGLYTVFGRNVFAAQTFCAVIGAATAPMVFLCAQRIYSNLRAAKTAAVIVAVFPAFVIWSGQLLKDGLIIFLLVLAMTMVLELQERIKPAAVITLGVSMAGIFTLRFYIFFMVAAAVFGSFVIGTSNSARSMVARTVVLVVLGLGLTYIGVTGTATGDLETYGNLERLQNGRLDQARTGKSGFAVDADVSTANGMITVLPIGFLYLMLAPFPWDASNLRQALPLPEVFVWWAMMPFLISGLIYSVRHRLRRALPILLFSLMLTLVYSISQGNVGTAYRQRTQIQVFLVIMIAVGWELRKEKAENRKLIRMQQAQRLNPGLRSRQEANS